MQTLIKKDKIIRIGKKPIFFYKKQVKDEELTLQALGRNISKLFDFVEILKREKYVIKCLESETIEMEVKPIKVNLPKESIPDIKQQSIPKTKRKVTLVKITMEKVNGN